MKVLIFTVTLVTTRHKKAESIGSDELHSFTIHHRVSVNCDGLSITGEE